MVRYRRNLVSGGTFFFTLTLADRRSSVLTDHIGLLRAAFRKTRDEHPFTIDAIVVLPEHLHAIMTLPDGDFDYSGRWRRLKGLFTRGVIAAGMSISSNDRGEYGLWQKRFWEHTVRDDGDFERCADYIHFNPVKHRLVTSPGVAIFVAPPLCPRRRAAGGLGWWRRSGRREIWGSGRIDGDGACESRVARRSTRATRPDL
jgi:putative transposase